MSYPTLLDITKANGSDGVTGLIDETIKAHPELTIGYARTIKGLNYKTLVRTAVPTGNGFRWPNAGVVAAKGTYENRLIECFTFNPRWECDRAVADRYEDGAAAFIALEASAIMEAAMVDLCKQFYYGTLANGNSSGFPGLLQGYDATNMTIDAGGTTASTGSSVWLVKFGPKNIGWVWGNQGQLQMIDPRIESIVPDATAPTARMTAYIQELLGYPGLQIGNLLCTVRIKKLTEDASHTLTDDMLYKALEKFPVGITPDVILMTRRSLRQLRGSRTAVNPTGQPAPIPTELEGIPIALTDSILNTEDLTL